MLELSASSGQGIFGCDEADIFSSARGHIGGINLTAPLPDWNMAVPLRPGTTWRMNTPILRQVWDAVYKGGKWKRHDWTIKLDPDTVFIPDKFRPTLASHQYQPPCQDGRGCFVMNCAYNHLYGAAEVLSSRAMALFGSQVWSCGYLDLEDQWLNACMYQYGIQQSDEFDAICMRGCDAQVAKESWSPGLCKQHYWSCDGPAAIWHAFEDAGSMKGCMMKQGVVF